MAYKVCDAVRINAGFMPTIYDKDVVSTGKVADTGLEFKDVYNRTSMAWGIGLDFKFGR